MKQEIEVTVKISLEVDSDKTKQDISEDIQRAMWSLFIRPNSRVHAILNDYKGGDTISSMISSEVVSIKEEKEIYKTDSE